MKLHRLDVVSLIFGTIFTLLGLAFVGFSNPWRALLVDVEWGWLAPLGAGHARRDRDAAAVPAQDRGGSRASGRGSGLGLRGASTQPDRLMNRSGSRSRGAVGSTAPRHVNVSSGRSAAA